MNFLSLQRCGSVAHVCIEYLAMTDARQSPAELSTAELYKRRDIDRPAVTARVRRVAGGGGGQKLAWCPWYPILDTGTK